MEDTACPFPGLLRKDLRDERGPDGPFAADSHRHQESKDTNLPGVGCEGGQAREE